MKDIFHVPGFIHNIFHNLNGLHDVSGGFGIATVLRCGGGI